MNMGNIKIHFWKKLSIPLVKLKEIALLLKEIDELFFLNSILYLFSFSFFSSIILLVFFFEINFINYRNEKKCQKVILHRKNEFQSHASASKVIQFYSKNIAKTSKHLWKIYPHRCPLKTCLTRKRGLGI